MNIQKTLEFKKDGKLIDLEIDYNGTRLSITATVWAGHRTPRTERTLISAGQSLDECKGVIPDRLLDIWEKWHLNDLRPFCEHQKSWDTKKQILVTEYTWTSLWYRFRQGAERGLLDPKAYEQYHRDAPAVESVLFDTKKPPLYPSEEVIRLQQAHYIEVKSTQFRSARWVDYRQHPEGLLRKPCSVCGYPYGTAWKTEIIPTEVLEYLQNL